MKRIEEYNSVKEFYEEYTKGQLTDQMDVELSVDNAALLIVDMLNDFCTPGGVMVMDTAKDIYAPLRNLIDKARENDVTIIYVNDCHRAGQYDAEFDKRPVHCIEGSWGQEVVDELKPNEGDLIVNKRRYSSFYQTDLELILRERGIDTVIITGVMTNICVRSTAHDAFFKGFNVIVPSDCCAASCQREQESSLVDINTCYGLVVESNDIIELMEKK